jgi:hypothetical protein
MRMPEPTSRAALHGEAGLEVKRGSKSIDGLGLASMVSKDALTGEGRSLSAIAEVELGVEVT